MSNGGPDQQAPFVRRTPEEHERWKRERPIRRKRHPLYRLKCRIKSMGEEAVSIRFQAHSIANQARSANTFPLRLKIAVMAHMIGSRDREMLRRESRATQLAYAFLRSRTYISTERTPHVEQNHKIEYHFWKRVEAIVQEFDQRDIREIRQQMAEWRAPQLAVAAWRLPHKGVS